MFFKLLSISQFIDQYISFFVTAQAVVNEDATGDVIALQHQIRLLKVVLIIPVLLCSIYQIINSSNGVLSGIGGAFHS